MLSSSRRTPVGENKLEFRFQLPTNTHSNFTAAHFEPLHNIFKCVLGAIRSDRHRFIVVGPEKIVISVRSRHITAILSEIKDCKWFNECESWPRTRSNNKVTNLSCWFQSNLNSATVSLRCTSFLSRASRPWQSHAGCSHSLLSLLKANKPRIKENERENVS